MHTTGLTRDEPHLLLVFAGGHGSTGATCIALNASSRLQPRQVRVDDRIRAMGGLAPTWSLHRAGHGRWELTEAVRTAQILRVRQGWYAVPEVAGHRLRAWRVGGRLTCAIGAREHGLWTRSSHPPLHVSVRPTQSRLRDPGDHHRGLTADAGATIHWCGDGRGSRFVASPLRCLLDMVGCEPTEAVVAAADCALGLGLISRSAWRDAVRALPVGRALVLSDVDPRSGSYLESVTRVRLRRAGVPVASQVQITSGIRVDFVIGGRVIVEVDGAEHARLRQLRIDRERDLISRRLGFTTLRYSGVQILRSWPAVLADIRAALARDR